MTPQVAGRCPTAFTQRLAEPGAGDAAGCCRRRRYARLALHATWRHAHAPRFCVCGRQGGPPRLPGGGGRGGRRAGSQGGCLVEGGQQRIRAPGGRGGVVCHDCSQASKPRLDASSQPPPARLTSAPTPLHSIVPTWRCAPPLAAVSHWLTLAAKRSEQIVSCVCCEGG